MSTEKSLTKHVREFGLDNFHLLDIDPALISQYQASVRHLFLDYPVPAMHIDKDNWRIPEEYKTLDIEKLITDLCPRENLDRVRIELDLYRKHNMIPVLKTVKYIVDILRDNGIVWGVGRGSSVASYCLHLLGLHKIDSVKYNIPLEEFFKENNNG